MTASRTLSDQGLLLSSAVGRDTYLGCQRGFTSRCGVCITVVGWSPLSSSDVSCDHYSMVVVVLVFALVVVFRVVIVDVDVVEVLVGMVVVEVGGGRKNSRIIQPKCCVRKST